MSDQPPAVYYTSPPPKKRRFPLCLFVMVCAGGVVVAAAILAFYLLNSPSVSVDAWWKQARPITVRFLDTTDIADQTPRMGLAPVIADLQQERRELSDLEEPKRAQTCKAKIVTAMEKSIQPYLNFLGGTETTDIDSMWKQATSAWTEAVQEPVCIEVGLQEVFSEYAERHSLDNPSN